MRIIYMMNEDELSIGGDKILNDNDINLKCRYSVVIWER